MRIRFLAVTLLALGGLQSPLHAAIPIQSSELDGLTIGLPPDSGWNRIKGAAQQIAYERKAQGHPAIKLTFSSSTIGPQPENQAFFRFAEARQEQTFSKLKKVSGHYYYGMHEQGVPCVRYDGIFEDKTAGALPFVSVRGQLCRHPASFEKMIQMELTQRSDTRESAYKADLSKTADQVFGATQFTVGAAEAAGPKPESSAK
ncbi:hypothetical protein M2650_08765 [Luteimonas sp. SX5]|uniref:Secreted protein n=1 Tax=Luteimonas galliterrae TaxID=2940486 RepID=A0ABT0MIM1_9GAMM|nr:hypothetical protein [Luteimonas galliterrae]MCL1634719.1 hypothetical protein [Luteimonas galliterrae]